MTDFIVTNTNDSGAGSLREALTLASTAATADRIAFAASLDGATITLTSGLLAIASGTLIIDGDRDNDGVADITVSGNNASSIFTVADGARATLDGLNLVAGYEAAAADSGDSAAGAIRNQGTLFLVNSTIGGCYAIGGDGAFEPLFGSAGPGGAAAGAILNLGELRVVGTSIEGNTAVAGEGASGASGGFSIGSYNGGSGGAGGDAAGGILNLAGGTLLLAGAMLDGNRGYGGNGGFGGSPGAGINGTGYPGNGGDGGTAASGVLDFGQASGSISGAGGVGAGGVRGLGGPGAGNQDDGFPGTDGRSGNLVLGIARGSDTVHAGINGPETYYGGFGNDTITGGGGADNLFGMYGDDTLTADRIDTADGGEGNDTIVISFIGNGVFKGGDDVDTLDLSQAQAVTGIYDLNKVFFTTSAGGRFTGFENLIGSAGDETLIGTAAANILDGGGGNDTLQGNGGGDTLRGGLGDDIYLGGGGTIVEDANGGTDTLVTNQTALLPFAPNLENVTLTGTEGAGVLGNDANNVLIGNVGANTLYGGLGNDRLDGGAGADDLEGNEGNDVYVNPVLGAGGDTIVEEAGAAGGTHDRIISIASFSIGTLANVEDISLAGGKNVNAIGNNLANILVGNSGNNTLLGGGGADTLTGGAGNDSLNGGSGADLFKFAKAGTGADRIEGFERTLDHFDLSGGLFANRTEAGGNTTLTHAGGTILIVGVTGLNVGQWNALVGGRAREATHDAAYALHHPAPLGYFGASDFLFA